MTEDALPPDSGLSYPKGAYFILGGYLLERFVYYGLFGGVVFYMQRMLQFSATTASTLKAVIEGLIYLAPIAGAVLADTYLGKFRTVLLMCCVYTLGSIIFSLSSVTPLMASVSATQTAGMLGIFVLGLSAGLMKAVYTSLGPDQFKIPEQRKQQERFFYMFYWMINAGAFLGQQLTAQTRATVQCFGDDCYMLPFVILCCLMVLSTTVFYMGKRWYQESPPDTTLIRSFKCIFYGIRRYISDRSKPVEHWLDRAKDKFELDLIKDVKKTLRVLLLFVTFPFFWALFYQTSTGMIFQAKRLDDRVGSYRIPPEITSSINPLLILILIPLFQLVIYPFCDSKKILTSTTSRMVFGMLLSTLSFVIYGTVNMSVEQKVLKPFESQLNIYNARNCSASLFSEWLSNDSEYLFEKEIKVDSIKMSQEQMMIDLQIKCGSFRDTVKITLRSEEETSVVLLSRQIVVLPPTKHYLKDKDAEAKVRIIDDSNSVENDGLQEAAIQLVYGNLVENLDIMNGLSEYHVLSPQNYTIKRENSTLGYAEIRQDGVYVIVTSDISSEVYYMTQPSTAHMAWLFPQYLVITTGEVLFSVSSMDFAYSEAPTSMKSVLQAANLFTITVGLWFYAILTKITSATNVFAYRASHEAFTYAVGMGFNTLIFAALVKYYAKMKSMSDEKVEHTSHENAAFEKEKI